MSVPNSLLIHNGKNKRLKSLSQRNLNKKRKPHLKKAKRTKIKTHNKKNNKKLSTFLTTFKINLKLWKYWLHQVLMKLTRRSKNWEIVKDCSKEGAQKNKFLKKIQKCCKKSKLRKADNQEQLPKRKFKLRKNSQPSDSTLKRISDTMA